MPGKAEALEDVGYIISLHRDHLALCSRSPYQGIMACEKLSWAADQQLPCPKLAEIEFDKVCSLLLRRG